MAKGKQRGTIKRHVATAPASPESHTRRQSAMGNNIRNWRLFLKIEKQEDLAMLTKIVDPRRKGLPRVTICRLETGETRYNEDHITLLSLAMGVAPRDLIGTNPYNAGDIFAVYAGLTDADKRKAAKLLASLKR